MASGSNALAIYKTWNNVSDSSSSRDLNELDYAVEGLMGKVRRSSELPYR